MKLNILGNHPLGQPDPFIYKDNNIYYIITSGVEGVHCYKSNKLDGDYVYVGIVFKMPGYHEYWAPSVIKIEDTFYMYVSCRKENEEDPHLETMMVATCKTADGIYQVANKKLIKPFSIDSHPVLNNSGLYLFYSLNNYKAKKAGTRIVVDKLVNPLMMEKKPRVKVNPSIEQEIFMKNRFKENQDWYTIEGACYFRVGDYHYLLYSANCYQSPYYFVNYAYAKSSEDDIRKIRFKKYPNSKIYKPLLATNEFETSTGHNSIIYENGNYYIIYHGREKNEVDFVGENRTMRIAKLIIDKEKLKIER